MLEGWIKAPLAPVVVTVSVEEPPPLVDVGLSEHFGAGLPPPVTAQVKFTVLAYPFRAETVTVEVADPPWATVDGFRAVADTAKSGTVAGLYAATNASGHGTLDPVELRHVPPP